MSPWRVTRRRWTCPPGGQKGRRHRSLGGDLVSEGVLILTVESAESTEAAAPAPLPGPPGAVAPEPAGRRLGTGSARAARPAVADRGARGPNLRRDRSPTPRRRCGATRASSASISPGSRGPDAKGRVLREDVSGFVKRALSAPAPAETPAGSRRERHPAHPCRGFLQVRGNRDPPAVPDQAHLGAASAPLLGERPPRHQPRRGRRHRAGSVPPIDQGRSGGRTGYASPSSPSSRRRWPRHSRSFRPSTRRSAPTGTP